VYSSLFLGMVTGALLNAEFNMVEGLNQLFPDGIMDVMTNKNNIGILVFLVILGTMVQLMNRTGGSAAFGMWASKRIKSRVGAQLSTMLLDPTKTTNYANYLCASCAAVFNS
jgi:Na+/H+ antiporter NhaC